VSIVLSGFTIGVTDPSGPLPEGYWKKLDHYADKTIEQVNAYTSEVVSLGKTQQQIDMEADMWRGASDQGMAQADLDQAKKQYEYQQTPQYMQEIIAASKKFCGTNKIEEGVSFFRGIADQVSITENRDLAALTNPNQGFTIATAALGIKDQSREVTRFDSAELDAESSNADRAASQTARLTIDQSGSNPNEDVLRPSRSTLVPAAVVLQIGLLETDVGTDTQQMLPSQQNGSNHGSVFSGANMKIADTGADLSWLLSGTS